MVSFPKIKTFSETFPQIIFSLRQHIQWFGSNFIQKQPDCFTDGKIILSVFLLCHSLGIWIMIKRPATFFGILFISMLIIGSNQGITQTYQWSDRLNMRILLSWLVFCLASKSFSLQQFCKHKLDAIHQVSFTSDGVNYFRASFTVYPDKVMVIDLDADQTGNDSAKIRLFDARQGVVTISKNKF